MITFTYLLTASQSADITANPRLNFLKQQQQHQRTLTELEQYLIHLTKSLKNH